MLDLSTARPSAPRQKGVLPAPLSCNSHRFPVSDTNSPIDIARPSPYPLPLPNGQFRNLHAAVTYEKGKGCFNTFFLHKWITHMG
eukprot:m.74254 g.74254  ORF g.74254 m.74254 type:complete len:85 (-) comp12453_c0_seq4:471-725(-)